MSAQTTAREILAKQIQLSLGGQMVDIELDIEHYDLAVTMGLQKLRQQSDGAYFRAATITVSDLPGYGSYCRSIITVVTRS